MILIILKKLQDCRPIVWTSKFFEKFEEYKRYSLRKYILGLIYDIGDITDKIRCDYFDVLATLYEEAFFKQLSKWCEDNNLMLTGHTEEWVQHQSLAQGDFFRTIRHLHIPGSDNHCYRYRFPKTINPVEAKILSSVCHITGKERAMSEIMGGAGWSTTLEEFKMGIDMLYAFGINMVVPHGFYYSYETPEAMDDWPTSWFFQNSYWKYFKKFADYISRLSYMNTGGRHHCRVVLLYPLTSMWANTRDNKVLTSNSLWGIPLDVNNNEMIKPIADYYNNTISKLVDNQIDLDIIDEGYLKQCVINNGRLSISDEEYSVLILPPLTTISKSTAEVIKKFYEQGGQVISMKILPCASCEEGRNDKYVVETFNSIFDTEAAREYTLRENKSGGKAYFIRDDIKIITDLVEKCAGRYITVLSEDRRGFYYIHKEKAGEHYYFLVNTRQYKRKMTLVFDVHGKPALWNPEDGLIKNIENYSSDEKGMRIDLTFEPRQSFYIVFNGIIKDDSKSALKTDFCAKNLDKMDLSEDWNCIVTPTELDSEWKSTLNESLIDIPVASFTWVKNQDNVPATVDWNNAKIIKILDSLCPDEGCGRYISLWNGKWIAYRPNWRNDDYKTIYFRKEFQLDENIQQITEAWFCLTAINSYELYINGRLIGKGSNWKKPATYNIKQYMQGGKNVVTVKVEKGKEVCSDVSGKSIAPESLVGFLGEGAIGYSNGEKVTLKSDQSWLSNPLGEEGWQNIDFQYKYTHIDIANNMWGMTDVPYGPIDYSLWINAWERSEPPTKPFGDLPLADKIVEYPVNLWYKIHLHSGSKGIHLPKIRGQYEMFINEQRLNKEQFRNDYYEFDKDICICGTAELAIKIEANNHKDGLLEPVKLSCEQFQLKKLHDWEKNNLGWYSGRMLYHKQIEIKKHQLKRKAKLNLGDVRFFAEIWVNGKLVDVRLWNPYEADISNHLIEGKNEITLIVSNLIANRMKWDIYDAVKGKAMNSYWHKENIDRDSENLVSGLLGPVEITFA